MLLGALNTATTGMNAMSSDMGTISQNISNMNTTGYKAEQANFDTIMSEKIQPGNDGSGSSPTGVSGFGVQAYNEHLNSIVGSMQTTSQYSDIAINGQGFFMVAPPSTTGGAPTVSSGSTLYTRNGAFKELAGSGTSQSSPRYLVNDSGDYLLGWQGNNGTVTSGGSVSPISIPQPQTVTRNGTTTTVDMVASATTQATVLGNVTPDNRLTSGSMETLPLTAFDSLSATHPFNLQFSPTTTGSTSVTTTDTSTTPPTITGPTTTNQTNQLSPNTWNLTFGTSETGATVTSAPTTTTTSSTSTTGSVTTDTSTSLTEGTIVTFNANGQLVSPKTVTFNATWANGQTSAITVDISGLTQYGGTTKSVLSSSSQNGYLDGQLQSLAFDSNGILSGSYSNGKNMQLAQVAVARFPAPDSLASASGTVFSQTSTSGAPIVDTAQHLGTAIEGSTLEASTTDLGTEFTNMIMAQKAYGLNSEVLKTADQMTQTITQGTW